MTLHALYGTLAPEPSPPEWVQTYHITNETGEGRVTIETLFPGMELCFNDMHLAWCNQEQPTAQNVLEINHCRVGRYECSFGENSCCYLAAGDLAVSAGTRKKSASCFPLRHYHGITLLLDLDALSPETIRLLETFGIDLNILRQSICAENRCCILRNDPAVERLFSTLYAVRPPEKPGHRKLAVLELLLFLCDLDTRTAPLQTAYFNQRQVACAKQTAARMTQDLQAHHPIGQLAQEAGLSPTALKTCFRGVYGTSLYAYLREYRLQTAQKLLTETDASIAEIAHRVGYENPNKFSSAFRQVFGMTPTEYRKRCPIG